MERIVVDTSRGSVELAVENLDRPVVLLFPGGHCDAMADVGWDLFRELGFGLVSVSRPGYGLTDVGDLTFEEFVGPAGEALRAVGVTALRAVVGVSFGGMPAVEYARTGQPAPAALVLASAAPSTLPYPDTRRDRLMGPIAFHPRVQGVTWRMLRAMVNAPAGLRLMAGSLSRLPVRTWWPGWSAADRQAARALFGAMASGSGFVNDLRQATSETAPARHRALTSVAVPTLVLGSVHDAGVSFEHARDEATTIPGARLVQTGAPSHLFWLGPARNRTLAELADFLENPPSAR